MELPMFSGFALLVVLLLLLVLLGPAGSRGASPTGSIVPNL